jgi:hypothetical protein
MDYETRRKATKARVDSSARSLQDLVNEMTEYSSYSYVSGVLRGEPGKKSAKVLDAIDRVLPSQAESMN